MAEPGNATVDWGYMDPMEPAEWAAIGVGIVVVLLNIVALVYAITHRDYLPIKAKQLQFIALSLFAGIIWYIGALVGLRVVPQAGYAVFLVCDLWTFWVQFVFGAFLWASALTFRLWRLYAIVKLNIEASTWKFKASFLILWFPTVVYGAIASGLHLFGPKVVQVENVASMIYQCYMVNPVVNTNLAIGTTYIVLQIFFAITLRNIKQRYLNEYREDVVVLVLYIITFVIYSALISAGYQFQVWGRVFCSFLVLVIMCLPAAIHLGYPVYQCTFHHDEYLDAFKKKLNQISVESSGTRTMSPSSSQVMKGSASANFPIMAEQTTHELDNFTGN